MNESATERRVREREREKDKTTLKCKGTTLAHACEHRFIPHLRAKNESFSLPEKKMNIGSIC